MDDEKTRRETALHASQSRETWIGRVAGAMAMEQLSALFARRRRSRASECGMGKDIVPGSRRIKVEPKNPRGRQHRARPCKKRKSGAPTVLMMPARPKARAPAKLAPEFVILSVSPSLPS